MIIYIYIYIDDIQYLHDDAFAYIMSCRHPTSDELACWKSAKGDVAILKKSTSPVIRKWFSNKSYVNAFVICKLCQKPVHTTNVSRRSLQMLSRQQQQTSLIQTDFVC